MINIKHLKQNNIQTRGYKYKVDFNDSSTIVYTDDLENAIKNSSIFI